MKIKVKMFSKIVSISNYCFSLILKTGCEFMDGQSLDIFSEKIAKLKELYPQAVTEEKIDWEKL